MAMYKPTELLSFLDELGIAPKKGLSQNFLIDGNILNKIATTAKLEPGDVVVEIGPGPGSLTEQLLSKGAHVLAVEKDNVLAEALHRFRTPDNHLDVHNDDILTFPLEESLLPLLKDNKKAKVIANLPYHLTTPIVVELVTKRHLFSHIIIMVQDEVARRFTAEPNTKEYGSFTVFLNFYTKPQYAFTVSNNCFFPSPKVNSAIVILELKEPPKVSDEEAFFRLTRTAFKQRRKMMRSSLRDIYPAATMEAALAKTGLNPLARPEDLDLDQFLKLFDNLSTS